MADNGRPHNGEHKEVLVENAGETREADTTKDSSICRCHPRWPCAIAYLLACVTYMIGMNVKRLPKEPFYWGNLLPVKMPSNWLDGVSMLMLMWNIHFVRRFAETLLIHIYKKKISILFTLGAPIYYSFFGLWIGWSMNYHFGYDAPPFYVLIPGTVLFVIGQIGNCISHIMLRRLRTTSKTSVKRSDGLVTTSKTSEKRSDVLVLPTGFMFKYVVCPHYTFEVITWIGYCLAAFTFPCVLFLVATLITLMILSRQRLVSLRKTFQAESDKEELAKRKALIPFVF